METKSVLHAAVGAPVVAARKVSGVVSDQVSTLKDKVGEEKANYSESAQKAIDNWAVEGEKVVAKVRERKVVEDISSRVDLDQAKEQVSKLRDQLEDMLATWKTSFRPEKEADKAVDAEAAEDVSEADEATETEEVAETEEAPEAEAAPEAETEEVKEAS